MFTEVVGFIILMILCMLVIVLIYYFYKYVPIQYFHTLYVEEIDCYIYKFKYT